MSTKVLFIGLGIMGRGMVANLLAADIPVTVWNRTPGRAEDMISLGAVLASSLPEAIAAADVICACVTGPDDVLELVQRPDGIAVAARPGTLFIDHSTIDPRTSQRVAELLAERRIRCLDAPVTGGEGGAKAGTLTVMVGGNAIDVEAARPFFDAIGSRTYHMGPHGSGQLIKLVANMIGGVTLAATVEGLVLAERSGIELGQALEVLRNSSANSSFLQASSQRLLDYDLQPGFSLVNRTKDLRLAIQTAEAAGIPLPLSALTRDLFASLVPEFGELDQIAYVKLAERLSGQPFPSNQAQRPQ